MPMPQCQFSLGLFLALVYIFLPLLLGWIHVSVKKLTRSEKIELFLIYYLAIGVGFQGLISGYLHLFHSEFVSMYFGWPDTPFISQVGMASLGYAVLGIGSIWMRGHWRTAAGIGFGVFLWLASIGHLTTYGSGGAILWSDILVPLAIFILLGMRKTK